VSVFYRGEYWHLFNANSYPLGRIAQRAAYLIRGRHKPTYDVQKMLELGDNVVIVNAENIMMTGKKRITKVYHHHTTYAGGLHTIPFKEMEQKHPDKLIKRTMRTMIPRVKIRDMLMDKKLHIFRGPHHTLEYTGLP